MNMSSRQLNPIKRGFGSKLLKLLALVTLAYTPSFAQGGPFGQPSIFWSGITATATWGSNNVNNGFARTTQAPLYPTGIVAVSFSNLTGAPVNCNVALNFGGQVGTTGSGALTTQNFTPSGTQTQYFRLQQAATFAFGLFTVVIPQWSCATYPTTGTINIEFIPDVTQSFSYYHATTNTSQTLKNGPAFVHSVVINGAGTTETITLFDNNACAGSSVAIITAVAGASFIYDVQTTVGLCVQTAGGAAGDFTVTYR